MLCLVFKYSIASYFDKLIIKIISSTWSAFGIQLNGSVYSQWLGSVTLS